jgi:hypothetical protein
MMMKFRRVLFFLSSCSQREVGVGLGLEFPITEYPLGPLFVF